MTLDRGRFLHDCAVFFLIVCLGDDGAALNEQFQFELVKNRARDISENSNLLQRRKRDYLYWRTLRNDF